MAREQDQRDKVGRLLWQSETRLRSARELAETLRGLDELCSDLWALEAVLSMKRNELAAPRSASTGQLLFPKP